MKSLPDFYFIFGIIGKIIWSLDHLLVRPPGWPNRAFTTKSLTKASQGSYQQVWRQPGSLAWLSPSHIIINFQWYVLCRFEIFVGTSYIPPGGGVDTTDLVTTVTKTAVAAHLRVKHKLTVSHIYKMPVRKSCFLTDLIKKCDQRMIFLSCPALLTFVFCCCYPIKYLPHVMCFISS